MRGSTRTLASGVASRATGCMLGAAIVGGLSLGVGLAVGSDDVSGVAAAAQSQ